MTWAPIRGELVHRHQAAQDDVILDRDMPGQGCHVGHDHVVADAAVMRHVGVGHEKVVAADHGFAVAGDRASVDRGKLADHVVVADAGPGLFAPVFQVLGGAPTEDW